MSENIRITYDTSPIRTVTWKSHLQVSRSRQFVVVDFNLPDGVVRRLPATEAVEFFEAALDVAIEARLYESERGQ